MMGSERHTAPAQAPPAPPPPTRPRRRRGAGVVLMVVAGLITLSVTSTIGDRVGTLAAARVNDPLPVDAPPPVPEDLPDGAQRYLAGVTVEEVGQDWLEDGGTWACEEGRVGPSYAEHEMTCVPEDEAAVFAFAVGLAYDSPDQVVEVNARCNHQVGMRSCKTFFSQVTAAVLGDHPEQVRKARRWVRRNMESDRSTVVGGTHLWMPVDASAAVLYVRPAA